MALQVKHMFRSLFMKTRKIVYAIKHFIYQPLNVILLVVGILLFILGLVAWILSTKLKPSDTITRILDIACFYLFSIGLIAILVSIISLIILMVLGLVNRKNQPSFSWIKLPITTALIFVFASLLIALYQSCLKTVFRNTTKEFLNRIPSNAIVKLNGKELKNYSELISQLKNTRPLPAHWSHATDKFSVEIIDSDKKLILKLGRDSAREKEYWVFYHYPQGYGYVKDYHIGGIITDLFKKIE